jgi:hypothetical protein
MCLGVVFMKLQENEIKKWLYVHIFYLGSLCLVFILLLLVGGAVATYPARLISFEVFVALMLVNYSIGILSFPEFLRCYRDLRNELKTKSITLYVQPGTGSIQLIKAYHKLSYRQSDRKLVDAFLRGIECKTVTWEYLSNSGLIVSVSVNGDRRVRKTDVSEISVAI